MDLWTTIAPGQMPVADYLPEGSSKYLTRCHQHFVFSGMLITLTL